MSWCFGALGILDRRIWLGLCTASIAIGHCARVQVHDLQLSASHLTALQRKHSMSSHLLQSIGVTTPSVRPSKQQPQSCEVSRRRASSTARSRAEGHTARQLTHGTASPLSVARQSRPQGGASDCCEGYFVLAGACVRSIPQIIRIQRSRSAEGLSEAANLSELIAYSIMIAYNYRLGYAFNTFGEVVACWFQDIVLAFLIVKYNRRISKRFFVYAFLFAAAFTATMTDVVSLRALTWLQASTIFIISLGGRVPQIVMNVRNGGSGQLSMVTCGMNVAGCFARMFTTLVLTQDIINFVGTAVQAVLNGILFYQCIRTAQRQQPPPSSTQTQAAFES